MTAATVSSDLRPELRRALTVERLLYGVIVLAGLFLRLYQLGLQPLTPEEAAQSWPLWRAAQGLPVDGAAPVSTSALLAALQYALFWLTQGGDVIARLPAALAGSALLFVPWLLRPWLGRAPALALALLFAIDPWLVAFSRIADGTMLATLFALAVMTCLARFSVAEDADADDDNGGRAWLYGGAMATGLLLVSGPLTWSYLIVLLLFATLIIWPNLMPGARTLLQTQTGRLVLVVGISALLAATLWLAQPGGPAAIGRSLAEWGLQLRANAYPIGWSALRLLADQAWMVIFAIVGFVMLWRGRAALGWPPGHKWPLFLTLWLILGFVGQLLPGRAPAGLVMLGLPMLFAAAHVGGALLEHMPPGISRAESGGLLFVLFVLGVATRVALNALVASPLFDPQLMAVTLLLGLGMLLVLVAYGAWAGWAQMLWLGGLFGALLLLLTTTANTWQLTHVHDMQRPNGLFATVTHPGVRTLRADLETLSAQRVGDAQAKPVQVQTELEPDPLLAWYLRERRLVEWTPAPPAVAGEAMPLLLTQLATSADTGAATGPAGTIGSDYHIRYTWLPPQLARNEFAVPMADTDATGWALQQARLAHIWQQRLYPIVQWVIQRKSLDAPTFDDVQLWVVPEE